MATRAAAHDRRSAPRLAALLDDLPLSSAAEHGAPAAAGAYLELLAEVFEDGVLTSDEARALADLATTYHLSREQVTAAHRGFLLALAHKAVEDGRITRDERTELLTVATALSFPDGAVKAILDEARAALADQRAAHCAPLPPGWPHGEPVRIGDGIAFTGCDDLERARLEGRARAVGLRVTGSVSAKTVLLVTDGADPSTGKAQAARTRGTRVVTPAVFAVLLAHIQPALPSPALVTSAAHPGATTRPADATPPAAAADHGAPDTADPATIRRWARTHGFAVSTRGRLSADVIAAFQHAHR
jgi:DNA polymerase-3 subunit epsilon